MTDITLSLDVVRRMDRVVLATLGLFALLLAAVPGQSLDSLVFTLDSLVFIAPFLLASLFTSSIPAQHSSVSISTRDCISAKSSLQRSTLPWRSWLISPPVTR